MADEHADPSGNTEAFRAFAQSREPAGGPATRLLLIISVVVAVVLLALLAWLALG